MNDRDSWLSHLKKEPLGKVSAESSLEERFQNETLRPILKMQNELFCAVFINYAIKQKGVFFGLNPAKKELYIEQVIQRDIKFRNVLKGMVIAYFTLAEWTEYQQHSSPLNKRMMNLLIERLKSQTQLLQP
ncbi:MAG: glyoxalase [Flavobacterium sp. BFFFF2]|nr:MAG: glyoxalase [Flavobacterium sp. BFFFF2]